MFRVKFNEHINKFELFNFSEYDDEINAPIILDIKDTNYDEFFKDINLNILKPINNCEDFIYTFVATNYAKDFLYDVDNLVGRSFGDLYPYLKEDIYKIFERVFNTHEKEIVNFYFYEENVLSICYKMDILFNKGEIYFLFNDITNEIMKAEEFADFNAAAAYLHDSEEVSIHYKTADGKYIWAPGIYELIEREPRKDDSEYHIIAALLSEDDRLESKRILSKLGNTGFLGKKIYTITTEKGNKKFIQIDSHNIYDNNGNFIRRCGFTKDVTRDILKNIELLSLSATVEDVQEAASISIHYKKANGEHIWSPETYKLIEREPRDTDKESHILLDLASPEDQEEHRKMWESLKPNEFLGTRNLTIACENGKVKHLQVDTRKLYDADGSFVQKSEYAMDVTEEFEYKQALIKADAEKTMLVKEVHHRVKNNLQVITSFLSLEERVHKNDPHRIIDITKKRINTLALIHERIYNEDNMRFITVDKFVNDFDQKLLALSNYDDIKFVNEIDDGLILSVDVMTPLVLMINELITNTFKYAFCDDFDNKKNKEIFKSFHIVNDSEKDYLEFVYKDNGKGLEDDFDINSSPSLGWKIIKSFTSQLDGEYELSNDNGLKFVLRFPYSLE